MYKRLYSQVIYPAYHGLKRDGLLAGNRELRGHDSLTPDGLTQLQANKLRALLRHANNSVPYFQSLLKSLDLDAETGMQPQGVLRSVPLMNKHTVREERQRLLAHPPAWTELRRDSTSGSTGSPVEFYIDRRAGIYQSAVEIRNRRWIGIDQGEVVAHLWSSSIDLGRAQALRGRIHSFITREIYLSAFHLTEEAMRLYARKIIASGARLLIGYPSVLVRFVRHCQRTGTQFPDLKAIICSAEALYPAQREEIETGFGVPVFNRYGSREFGDIAHQVPGDDGMLVNADRVYVEILDSAGKPCEPGTVGDIVITDLDNYGMPFIRYQIGDRGSWSAHRLKDKPYPVLKTVEGRTLDVVTTPDGREVGGTFWTILLRKRAGILDFQVVQHDPNGVVVRYVRDPSVASVDETYFRDKIAEICGDTFDIKFEAVVEVTPEPNGKFRIVKSELATDNKH